MKNKLKDNSGSAMILAIFSIIIVSLLGIYITSQIGNQLKSSNNTYEDMQVIYMAESSIEKTIYDLENQIYNKLNSKKNSKLEIYNNEWVDVDHTTHEATKVKYKEEGKIVDHISFNNLIYNELIYGNGSNDTYWGLHNQVIVDMQLINQQTSNKFSSTTSIFQQLGGYLISSSYNTEENLIGFVNSVNESINQLNSAKEIYISNLPNIEYQKAIDRLDRLKGVFEEVLCRLGFLKVEESKVEYVPVNIKLYSRTMNSEGEIIKEEFKIIDKDREKKDLAIKFIYKENKLEDINFDKLNEVLDDGIYGEGILKNNLNIIEYAKKVYKIRFGFDNGKVNYNITYIANE